MASDGDDILHGVNAYAFQGEKAYLVFENGRKKGEIKFEHHENRLLPFITQDDRRRPAVRDVESSGEFGHDFLFPLGR